MSAGHESRDLCHTLRPVTQRVALLCCCVAHVSLLCGACLQFFSEALSAAAVSSLFMEFRRQALIYPKGEVVTTAPGGGFDAEVCDVHSGVLVAGDSALQAPLYYLLRRPSGDCSSVPAPEHAWQGNSAAQLREKALQHVQACKMQPKGR